MIVAWLTHGNASLGFGFGFDFAQSFVLIPAFFAHLDSSLFTSFGSR